jgi:ComF family protein
MKVNRKIWDIALNIFYPPKCPGCGCAIYMNEVLCEDCRKIIKRADNMAVVYRGKNSEDQIVKSYCISPFYYGGKIGDAIKGFKFDEKTYFSNSFALCILHMMQKNYKDKKFDIITFVPSSKKRQQEANFINHAKIIAKSLSMFSNIKFESLLERIKDSEIQHRLSAAKRRENVRGAYIAINRSMVSSKSILLVDDVVTTQSTLNEICEVLYENGANEVNCATVAMTPLKNIN